MSVQELISLEEYLTTSYRPDMEYVDGVLEERFLGDWAHSSVQANLIFGLSIKYPQIHALPSLRSKMTATRFRVPDVCVLQTIPRTKYLEEAAFLAIEVLSPDDRMSKTMEKLQDYSGKGVRNIWVIDPRRRSIAVYSDGALNEVRGDSVATIGEPRLELTRDEIFKDLPDVE